MTKDKIWPRADNFRAHLKRVHHLALRETELEPFVWTSMMPPPIASRMSTLVAIARLQQDLAGMEKALDGLSPEDGLQSLDEESRSDIPSVQVDYQVFQAFIKTGKIMIVGNRSPGPIQSATTGHTETAKHKATEFPAAPFQTSDRGGTKNDIFSSKQPLSSPAALSDFQVSERIEPAATSLPNAKLSAPRHSWLRELLCGSDGTDREVVRYL